MSAFTSAVDFLPRDGDADLGRCLPQKPMLTAAPPAVRPANDFPPSIRPALRRCCDCIHGSPALAVSNFLSKRHNNDAAICWKLAFR